MVRKEESVQANRQKVLFLASADIIRHRFTTSPDTWIAFTKAKISLCSVLKCKISFSTIYPSARFSQIFIYYRVLCVWIKLERSPDQWRCRITSLGIKLSILWLVVPNIIFSIFFISLTQPLLYSKFHTYSSLAAMQVQSNKQLKKLHFSLKSTTYLLIEEFFKLKFVIVWVEAKALGPFAEP